MKFLSFLDKAQFRAAERQARETIHAQVHVDAPPLPLSLEHEKRQQQQQQQSGATGALHHQDLSTNTDTDNSISNSSGLQDFTNQEASNNVIPNTAQEEQSNFYDIIRAMKCRNSPANQIWE